MSAKEEKPRKCVAVDPIGATTARVTSSTARPKGGLLVESPPLDFLAFLDASSGCDRRPVRSTSVCSRPATARCRENRMQTDACHRRARKCRPPHQWMDESSKLVQSLLGVSRPVLIFPHADPFSLPIERLRRARRVLFVFRANPHGRTMPADVELLHARRRRGVSAIRRAAARRPSKGSHVMRRTERMPKKKQRGAFVRFTRALELARAVRRRLCGRS